MVTIDSVIEKAQSYLPNLDVARVRRAFDFADAAHAGQKRFSGEPYIVHPLNVAYMLIEYHPDENAIITALLHDVAEDTTKTLDDIEAAFGNEVRTLCSGLVKLSKVRSKLNDPQVENLRKLFLAMASDFRVVMLKLCDRLHNMSTLEFVRPEKRMRIAQETLNIYAPIAARLGIYRLKTELEDLCFKYLYPTEYGALIAQLDKTEKWRDKYIDIARKIILDTLSKEGLTAEVDGRVKGLYSIFRKMQKKNKTSIDEVFDVFAMRIVLPDIIKYGKEYTGHVYTTLGILHNAFTPLAHRFKDYIAVPKVNGYRSLHTTVVGLGPKTYTQPTEIQIRTNEMHQSAEFGIAAHWIYEEKGVVPSNTPDALKNQEGSDDEEEDGSSDDTQIIEQQKEWIVGLRKIEEESKSNQELLENLKSDTFQDRIFVLTPRGDVRDLPAGATPIDFAFAVHTEIGNHCIGAKVNGTMVPIDSKLKSGDVVEISTRKNAHPSLAWLGFVKTTHARNRVRSWFRGLDEEKHLRDGKELLNKKLIQLGRPPLDMTLSVLKNYDGATTMREREDILRDIGRGGLFVTTILKKIFTLDELLESKGYSAHRASSTPRLDAVKERADERKLIIGGEKDMPHSYVKCCSADGVDDLVGYITRGRGVSVHRKNCPVIRNSETQRLVSVYPQNGASGASGDARPYAVHVLVDSDDRMGLVRDITDVIYKHSINILDFFQDPPSGGKALVNFILDIKDFDQLERVLSALEKIPSVRRACKVN